jgi:hypothetical protein
MLEIIDLQRSGFDHGVPNAVNDLRTRMEINLTFIADFRVMASADHLGPIGVEHLAAGFVDALVGVGAEKVALGL